MSTSAKDLSAAIADAAARELTSALARIVHCLNQLSDDQVWQEPAEGMNSVANLILHLSGNLRQWIIAGLGGAPDTRDRPKEFTDRSRAPKAQVLRQLQGTVDEVIEVLARVPPAEWIRQRSIQSFEVTGLDALFDSVPHFRGHTQEIVHITRMLKGKDYRFAWVPATKEEGAAG